MRRRRAVAQRNEAVADALSPVTAAELGLAETRRFPDVGFTLRYQDNSSGRESVIPGASVTLPILDNGDPAVAMQMAKLKQVELELLAAIEEVLP